MSTIKKKAEKAAFTHMKQAHRERWGAPIGKRKCHYSNAKDCLGIDDEELFIGHKCKSCVRLMHRDMYKARLEKQGKELVGRGRPLGAKDKQPRINAKKD